MSDRACVVLLHDYVLMVYQSYQNTIFWTLPGGKVELNEEPVAAAIREIKDDIALPLS